MPMFTKMPCVIEAHRFTTNMQDELAHWCKGTLIETKEAFPHKNIIIIKTLEGDMIAEMGDWIIKGVKGEFYPCKPDIFALTYELVPYKF